MQLSCLQWVVVLLAAITISATVHVRLCLKPFCPCLLQASNSTAWVCLWNFSSPEQMLKPVTLGQTVSNCVGQVFVKPDLLLINCLAIMVEFHRPL